MKNLTIKRILRNHQNNPQDQELHAIIENADVETKDFDAIVEKGAKQKPYDKK